jgi:hypothetical protein
MSREKMQVECAGHGKRPATFLCQHLVDGHGLGFHWAADPEEPDEACPIAWCDACDEVLEAERGWSERAKAAASMRLLCDACYEELRDRSWRQDDAAFERLVEDSVAFFEARQEDLWAKFRIDECEAYHWDQEIGELVFSHDGRARVIADIQFVGSFSTQSDTWMWSWANPSFVEAVKARVRAVREHGDRHGFLKLAAAHWGATEQDGWEMTAVTARLLGALGAYRTPGENSFVFMVLTAVRWADDIQ